MGENVTPATKLTGLIDINGLARFLEDTQNWTEAQIEAAIGAIPNAAEVGN